MKSAGDFVTLYYLLGELALSNQTILNNHGEIHSFRQW